MNKKVVWDEIRKIRSRYDGKFLSRMQDIDLFWIEKSLESNYCRPDEIEYLTAEVNSIMGYNRFDGISST